MVFLVRVLVRVAARVKVLLWVLVKVLCGASRRRHQVWVPNDPSSAFLAYQKEKLAKQIMNDPKHQELSSPWAS